MKYRPTQDAYQYEKGDRVALLGTIEDARDAGNLVIRIDGHPLEYLHIAQKVLLGVDGPRPLDVLLREKQADARAAAGVPLPVEPVDGDLTVDPVAEPGAATDDPNLQPGPTEPTPKEKDDEIPF